MLNTTKTTRYLGERVELSRNCDLGQKGEWARVEALDGRSMTLVFPERSRDATVYTGADYLYLRTVSA